MEYADIEFAIKGKEGIFFAAVVIAVTIISVLI